MDTIFYHIMKYIVMHYVVKKKVGPKIRLYLMTKFIFGRNKYKLRDFNTLINPGKLLP